MCRYTFNNRYFFLDWENNYFVWKCGQISSLRTLELLFGASSLSALEHVEAHSLSQGLALTSCDNVANVDIPEAGGAGAWICSYGIFQSSCTFGCSGGSLGG